MRVVTGTEMTALDNQAIQEYHIPQAALMERAGHSVALHLARNVGSRIEGARIHVLCGAGNNGGDGFVAARSLLNMGARVRVTLLTPPERIEGDARLFLRAIAKMGAPIATLTEDDVKKLALGLNTCDVIVDAMLGTGVKGPLRPLFAQVAEAVNRSNRPVVAVDIPTGVQADSGKVEGHAVRATSTVAFGLPKVGHLLPPGRDFIGELEVCDIGFPRELMAAEANSRVWIRREEARAVLKPRPPWGHKGTFGRVVVVAGSVGMAGAAALTVMGALRSGAGLVTWMGPELILDVVQKLVPEATAIGLSHHGGKVQETAVRDVLKELRPGDALALGPGLGQGDQVAKFVSAILAQVPVPVVVDADALNALASLGHDATKGWTDGSQRIFTPHPKEAARLLSSSVSQVIDAPLLALERLALQWKCTALLKGSPTLVQERSGRVNVIGSGDVALATGGSGDVLTGVIASLLAQNYTAGEAAVLGAYVHGQAGELCRKDPGRHGTVARDVAHAVGRALASLERKGDDA